MSHLYKKTVFISAVAAVIFTGCAHKDIGLAQTGGDLNISRNSIISEHENMKMAVAILIKKNAEQERQGSELKDIAIKMSNIEANLKSQSLRASDIQMRFDLLASEISNIKSQLDAIKIRNNPPAEQAPTQKQGLSSEIKATPSDLNSSFLTVSPTNKEVGNKKQNSARAKPQNKCAKENTGVSSPKHPLKKINMSGQYSTSDKTETEVVKLESTKKLQGKTYNMKEMTGKLITKFENVYSHRIPSLDKETRADKISNGAELLYVAKGKDWYRLNNGNFIHKSVVVDLTEQIQSAKKSPLVVDKGELFWLRLSTGAELLRFIDEERKEKGVDVLGDLTTKPKHLVEEPLFRTKYASMMWDIAKNIPILQNIFSLALRDAERFNFDKCSSFPTRKGKVASDERRLRVYGNFEKLKKVRLLKHTYHVVFYASTLKDIAGGNYPSLLLLALLHDFGKNNEIIAGQGMTDASPHEEISSMYARAIMKSTGDFTKAYIDSITKIIATHHKAPQHGVPLYDLLEMSDSLAREFEVTLPYGNKE